MTQKNGETTKVYTEEVYIDFRFAKGSPIVPVLMDNVVTNVQRVIIT